MALQFRPYPIPEEEPDRLAPVADSLTRSLQMMAQFDLQKQQLATKQEETRQQRIMDYIKLKGEYGESADAMLRGAGIQMPGMMQGPLTAEALGQTAPGIVPPAATPTAGVIPAPGADPTAVAPDPLSKTRDFLANLRRTKGQKGVEQHLKETSHETNMAKDMLDIEMKKESLEKSNRGKTFVTREELMARPDRALAPGEELMPNDPVATQTRNAELQLSNEFSQQSKDFRTAASALPAVISATPDAAGDMQMIFGLMKIYDPNSVVRETEFANAENARGVPESVRATWNKIKSGERLSEQQRQQFKASAINVYKGREGQHVQLENEFGRQAAGWGLKPDQIIRDYKVKLPAGGGAPDLTTKDGTAVATDIRVGEVREKAGAKWEYIGGPKGERSSWRRI